MNKLQILYVHASFLSLLLVLVGFVVIWRREKGKNRQLKHVLNYDSLTDLYNRSGFLECVSHIMKTSKASDKFALLYFNIKEFKVINELFGIESGDYILKESANLITHSKLKPLACGRIEADHFVMCIEQQNLDLDELTRLCNRFYIKEGKPYNFYARCGIFLVDDKTMNVSGMCDRAKLAKQFITDDYLKPYAFYRHEMKEDMIKQRELTSEMKSALAGHEFRVYLQPIYDAKTDEIVSAEALVRWIHPNRGVISPADFIPIFETNGYITELDTFVAREVVRMQKKRLNQNGKLIPIAINLSRMDFYTLNLYERIFGTVKENNIPLESLRIEVTESAYAELTNQNTNVIQHMKQDNIKIMIDDFGSGYSSFSFLQDLTFDMIKLDMDFVQKIGINAKSECIISYLIEMAHRIGTLVVAEGAETKEQVDFLKKANCDFIQGYYYSRPLPENEFEKLLDGSKKVGMA